MKISSLVPLIGGTYRGDDLDIFGVSSYQYQKPNTLVFLDNIITDFKDNIVYVSNQEIPAKNLLIVEDVKYALATALEILYKEDLPKGISEKSSIGENTTIGKDVYIGDFVYIGKNVNIEDNVLIYPFTYIGDNTQIGENTIIYSGVHIYKNSIIGKNVIIHSGAVIGTDGFGYAISKKGIKKLKHIGTAIIEDNVEIGANTTIDRALIDTTYIGKNTKIDKLVLIAHNVKVGQNCFLAAQTGLSGSVEIGNNVILAGQVGVADHVKIGDNVKIAAKSGVANDLEPNKTYGANLPVIEWNKWKRVYISLLKLPDIIKKLKA